MTLDPIAVIRKKEEEEKEAESARLAASSSENQPDESNEASHESHYSAGDGDENIGISNFSEFGEGMNEYWGGFGFN